MAKKLLALGVALIMAISLAACTPKEEEVPKEWGEKISVSEFNGIVDATVSEFRKENPNAEFNYGFRYSIEDPANGIWLIVDPLFRKFSWAQEIIMWQNDYYAFENNAFVKCIMLQEDEYEKVIVADIQQGKTLYDHILENADSQSEGHFELVINMLLDMKQKFDVYKSAEGVYRFRTKKGDNFSIWNMYSFNWNEGNRSYETTILTGEVKVSNGKITQLGLLFDDGKLDVGFGVNFAYGNISLTLPQ